MASEGEIATLCVLAWGQSHSWSLHNRGGPAALHTGLCQFRTPVPRVSKLHTSPVRASALECRDSLSDVVITTSTASLYLF